MKSIDVKSLIIGILGTALVFVLMGLSKSDKSRIVGLIESCKVETMFLPHHKAMGVAKLNGDIICDQ